MPSLPIYMGIDPSALSPQTPILALEDLSPDQRRAPPLNSIFQRWDYIGLVTPSAINEVEQEPWRTIGDPAADKVVEALGLGPGVDGLAAVMKEVEKEDGEECVKEFWRSMCAGPPGEKGGGGKGDASDDDGGAKESTAMIKEGQDVFWRYSAQIFAALMHFSLAGGFSSPNLAGVLRETGYLTSASKDATYKRLLETTLFVIDAMSDVTPVTSRGFKSALRVRLLHAQVRRKIRLGKGREKTYDEAVSGVPISQVDLALVLGSFMIAPLWSMQRMGIKITPRESSAYQAVWTHVGFYLGVDPRLLSRCYNTSFSDAEVAFASLAFSAFPLREPPSDPRATPTYSILSAVAGRPPMTKSTIGYHFEYSRLLLGDGLANHLALPPGTASDRWRVWVDVTVGRVLVEFGRRWRKGWERERVSLTGDIIELLVVWGLGERRTVFSAREEKDWEEKLREGESEPPGIKMGKEVGASVRSRWQWLIAELGAVVVSTCVVGIVASVVVARGVSYLSL